MLHDNFEFSCETLRDMRAEKSEETPRGFYIDSPERLDI